MAQAYEVLGGTHTDAAGKVYRTGEVVYSNEDLVRMFPNTFRKVRVVHGSPKPDKDAEAEIYLPPPPSHAGHVEDKHETPPNTQAPNPEDQLVPKSHAGHAEDKPEESGTAPDEDSDAEGDVGDTGGDESGHEFGEEVTKEFPKARRHGFKVFKKGREFTVTNTEGKEAVNEKPLHTRHQVEKLIEDAV